MSSLDEQRKRIPYAPERLKGASEPEKATFRVRLPKGYRASSKRTYGLVVWLSPDTHGISPEFWGGVLKSRGLILVGPDGAGNDQEVPRRIALALDAVAGARARYRIDPARVFAIGFSGGGNVVCWLGLHYPEVFRAVAPLSGCDSFRPVPVPGREGSYWRGTIPEPSPERLVLAKRKRWVFLAGDQDPQAKVQAEAVSALYRSLGFQAIDLQIVPQLAHYPVQPKTLRALLRALEKPPTPEPPASPTPEPPASPAPTPSPSATPR